MPDVLPALRGLLLTHHNLAKHGPSEGIFILIPLLYPHPFFLHGSSFTCLFIYLIVCYYVCTGMYVFVCACEEQNSTSGVTPRELFETGSLPGAWSLLIRLV